MWNVNTVSLSAHAPEKLVLIETLWNVNPSVSIPPSAALSINRNIVECKYLLRRCIRDGFTVLIETLWNVNSVYTAFAFKRTVVLIETLWNVNKEEYEQYIDGNFVLIETLWNVNLIYTDPASMSASVLIETLWNVNMFAETV